MNFLQNKSINFVKNNSNVLLISATVLLLPIYRGGYNYTSIVALIFCSLLLLVFLDFENTTVPIKKFCLFWLVLVSIIFIQPFFSLINEVYDIEKSSLYSVDYFYTLGLFTAFWLIVLSVITLRFQQISWIIFAVLLSSIFQAIYGLYHLASDSQSVLGLWDKRHYHNSVTGTFVNKNIFAGMLAMSWPLVMNALLTNQLNFSFFQLIQARYLTAFSYSCVVMIALVTSHSRMGLVAALFGFVVWGYVFFKSHNVGFRANKNNGSSAYVRFIPFALFFILLLFGISYGLEDIASRYAKLESGDSRLDIWRSLFSLPFSVWLTGVGPGVIEHVLEIVKPAYFVKNIVYAHNDYLQFVLQFGLVFTVIIGLLFYYLILRNIPKGSFKYRAGAVGSLSAMAMHSIVDCNMQIPGSAIIAWVAFGVLMNPNLSSIEKKSEVTSDYKESQLTAEKIKIRSNVTKKRKPSKNSSWFDYFKPD